MRMVWSNKEGYTFIKDVENCIAFETGKIMTYADIADCLNMTSGGVSTALRRSIGKIYCYLKEENEKLLSSIEIIMLMTEILEIESEEQYVKFINLLPSEIREEVYKDAFKEYRRQYKN